MQGVVRSPLAMKRLSHHSFSVRVWGTRVSGNRRNPVVCVEYYSTVRSVCVFIICMNIINSSSTSLTLVVELMTTLVGTLQ